MCNAPKVCYRTECFLVLKVKWSERDEGHSSNSIVRHSQSGSGIALCGLRSIPAFPGGLSIMPSRTNMLCFLSTSHFKILYNSHTVKPNSE